MSAHVLGLDLGLATAGAAQIHHDGRIYTRVKTTDPLPDGAPIEADVRRIRTMAAWAVGQATRHTVLVVVEGPSYGSKHGQAHERAAVWWRTIESLAIGHEIPVAVAPPLTAKRYIAGHGGADKAAVRRAVAAALPGHGLERVTDHEADAVALALCGTDFLGWPGPWLEGRRGASLLTSVRWPEREAIRA